MNIDQWANDFVAREQSAMRGGQRRRNRFQIRDRLEAANKTYNFGLTTLQILWWVVWIWMKLRK